MRILGPKLAFCGLFLLNFSLLHGQKQWTLAECIDTALERNIQLKQSALQIELTENTQEQRVAGLFPTVNGSAGYGWNFGLNIDPVTNLASRDNRQTNNLSLNAQWTLFDGLQNVNSLAQSRIDHAAQLYQLEDVRNNTALNVASLYLQVLLNTEILRIAEEQEKLSEVQVRRTADLVETGSLPKGNLYDNEAQLARDHQSSVSAKNQLNISKLRLAQAMQMNRAQELEVAPVPDISPDAGIIALGPDRIYESALQNQPNIKSRELQLESADKGVSVSRGSGWPTLSLVGSIGTNYSNQVRSFSVIDQPPSLIGATESGENVFNFGSATFESGDVKPFWDQYQDNVNEFVGLNLQIPIFSGLQIRNGIRSAQISRTQAELNLTNERNTLRQTIQQAHADALAAYETFQATERSVEAGAESFEYARVRYENGVINFFEYENARNRLTSAKAQLAQARYDWIFRVKTLEFYLNGSLQP